ncbi:VOC family protein [Temperatibacter marinus]|uniref:VOC family protein n=1 Tax=Temperatibacter marinus TaxID=1456591 RepID=A0AA52EGR7_9PROT|nr:VOC family protein [Temperatibacter marinus]WND02039.1 VOC family protein [Temperatibacter marinus]
MLKGIHHVAYRCVNAKETVEFYTKHLGMDFQLAIAEDAVPSTGQADPYMHIFLDAGRDNVLAFFELPNSPKQGKDPHSPEWVQHIAFEVESEAALLAMKESLVAAGIEVLGPTDHGIFESIYFFDPSGHRLELAANKGTPAMKQELKRVAWEMLTEWDETKKAPKHAAWLHDGTGFPPKK